MLDGETPTMITQQTTMIHALHNIETALWAIAGVLWIIAVAVSFLNGFGYGLATFFGGVIGFVIRFICARWVWR